MKMLTLYEKCVLLKFQTGHPQTNYFETENVDLIWEVINKNILIMFYTLKIRKNDLGSLCSRMMIKDILHFFLIIFNF